MDVLLSALLGMLVSFLGQLPLGNLSITATQIGLEEGFKRAWMYSIGDCNCRNDLFTRSPFGYELGNSASYFFYYP